MKFNEDTRVKIPAILHLVKLGYEYLSLKNAVWDLDTNIFPELFSLSISRINPDIKPDEVVLNKYVEFVKPNFEKRMAVLDENEKLTKLRVWLLPMLMNGRVKVG